MSFPFVQPYFGLGNSLQTAQAAAGGPVGGWVELGRTTLGSAGDDITVSSLPDKRYYMVLTDLQDTGGSIHAEMRLNGDTGSNYAYRYNNNGGTDVGAGPATVMALNPAVQASDVFSVGYLSNLSSKEKLHINHCVNQYAAGATTAPHRQESVNKHAQTSNPINSVTIRQGAGSGDYAIGSECVVLGWDPDDTHTTNFWEELASVQLGSASDTLSSGTIAAKKYLFVQTYTKATGGTVEPDSRFNSDSGTNYADRYSINGGSDGTGTSISQGVRGSGVAYRALFTDFIINNASNEKLVIRHVIYPTAAGAGTAPSRRETVGKWANTSSQITSIDWVDNSGSGAQMDTGSFIKVWGSD
jgi:hypothetical protein